VGVVRIPRKADLAEPRSFAPGEDSNPIEALLPMPDSMIAGAFDLADRQRIVGTFQFLETDDVGLLTRQIFEQPLQTGPNAVEVIGNELHGDGISRRQLD
jgi:hypothetical protein